MQNISYILQKYWDIIKEEVNVKQLDILPDDIKVKKIYVPIWSVISKRFGKDTWNIIKFAKMWNVEILEDWKIKVFSDDWKEWVLNKEDYQVRFEGLDEKTMAAEENVVVKLDLNITEELKKEGIAREISRFLNQLRKEANYNVDDRVVLYFNTDDNYLKDVVKMFEEFLKREVLLKQIVEEDLSNESVHDICKVFETDEGKKIKFCLKK